MRGIARGLASALVGSALLVGGTGCATIGKEFPVEPVRRIEIGVTTMADIQEMFGPPWRTGVDSGRKTWTYGRYRYSLFGRDKTRDLVVRFEDGVVHSYTFNSTEPEDAVR
jgi:hypothetical protein